MGRRKLLLRGGRDKLENREKENQQGDGGKANKTAGEEEKRREHRGRRRLPEGLPKLQTLPRELRGAP